MFHHKATFGGMISDNKYNKKVSIHMKLRLQLLFKMKTEQLSKY